MGNKMKILVTGGLGLIGHNVVHRLENLGHDVVIVDNQTTYGIIPPAELDYLITERRKKITSSAVYKADIRSDTIEYLCKRYKFDIIIHMASFPRQKVVNVNPMQGADTMMTGLLNILESAKTHQVQRVVYISSSMVYGDFTDNVSEDAVCRPQGQYGIMKLAGEHLVKDYTRRGCFDYVILRPSAVYGPLDVEDRVVSKFMLAAMQDQVLKVNGANETLDFTYVDDAADGVVSAALIPAAANQTFNITKSHSVSLLKAAEMIVRMVGKGSYQLHNKDADFPSRGALNIDRARAVLGYDPKVDVEEGFENYYVWLKNSVYWSPLTV
jgi:UDP-glucose 4-epimerase